MSVGKQNILFVCRYLITRDVTRKSDLKSFPGGELLHVETEGLIECIHTVCGANNSKGSKITTSN